MKKQIRTLAAALVWLASSSALADSTAPNTTGGAIPDTFAPATKKESINPAIVKPDDPSGNCVTNITPEDERAAKNGGVVLSKSCLPQADAFTRAGEAASYLAHYYQRYTPYANEMRAIDEKGKLKNYQNMIRGCVTGQPECGEKEKAQVLKAMVQYNFGKEIRAQVLEGRTRAELMKSVDLGAKGWRELGVPAPKILTKYNALKTGTLRKNTFRLDPTKIPVVDLTKLTQQQRQVLGANYMNHFNEFFDSYSKTTGAHSRWHYVAARSSAVGSDNVYRAEWNSSNQDAKLGKTLINQNRLDIDQRSQDNAKVNEIVKVFKDDMRKETIERSLPQRDNPKKIDEVKVEPYRVALHEVGLGLMEDKDSLTDKWMEPKEVAAAVVITINKAIHDTEEREAKKRAGQRMPSSSGSSSPTKTISSISVDIKAFDNFLNAIWPADVARQ